MNFKGVDICCPYCRQELEQGGSSLRCVACRREFPVLAGIPDLRIFSDPYIDIESDRQKGLRVAAAAENLNFSQLIDFYYSITDVVPAHQARLYKCGLMAGVARAEAALAHWEKEAGNCSGTLLEIGCGTAPLLVAGARKFRKAVGIDIAFRWLVVAKKRLEEAGLDLPLICACAEALPFGNPRFDWVIFDSTIEVVANQQTALAESYRVAGPAGVLCIATPNKLSIGPDPHMGIPAGGLWPEKCVAFYARLRKAVPPKRHLLSCWSFRQLAMDAGFESPRLLLPNIPEAQRTHYGKGIQWLISIYRMALRIPFARLIFLLIGPTFLAVTRKPAATKAAA